MTKRYRTMVALFWIFGVTTTAHLLYSALGFNPTDDGFTLAYARRLLDGQIPHRDFVIIRPALSPALHMPEVLLGGQFTYWLSRFIFFFQCACIAWFGTAFINRGLGRPMALSDQCAFAVISFVLGCHSFPAMAWHTIDGFFLCMLAFHIRSVSSVYARPLAYVLMGLAYLCKQSFLFVAPGALLIFGDWRDWRNPMACALPAILYIAMLGLFGGIFDGWQQLFSQTGILQVGFSPYFDERVFSGVLAGIAATSLLYSETQEGWPRTTIIRLLAACACIGAIFMLAISSLFSNGFYSFSFALFGMVCGAILYLVLEGKHRWLRQIQTGMVAVLLAWSVALSLGYNSPVLGGGMLLVFLLGLLYERLPRHRPRWLSVVPFFMALPAIAVFHHTRTHHIYRDRPASELTASVGDILPGGGFIRTNPNTHAFLTDLNLAIAGVVGRGFEYAIVPDVAGHWAKSEQENPLPIDWVQGTELNTETLRRRVIRSIENRRNRQMIIVQKFRASVLPKGFAKLVGDKSYYAIVSYIKVNLEKRQETRYFEIYQ